MKKLYGIAVVFALAGCTTTTDEPPATEVRIVEKKVPVPVACVDADSVPGEPEKVGDRLTGKAAHDADILAASAIKLRQWGRELRALIVPGCTKP